MIIGKIEGYEAWVMMIFISDECTTYSQSQCIDKCNKTSRVFHEYGADSTCPCKCSCPEFNQVDCEMRCEKEGKQTLKGLQDQFGCMSCECFCVPFNNNICHDQCVLERKIQVVGARNRFGCDICQCGCLNRDCETECGNLEYRVTTGSQGCIVGCQCICPDQCEPNCHGCVKKGYFILNNINYIIYLTFILKVPNLVERRVHFLPHFCWNITS